MELLTNNLDLGQDSEMNTVLTLPSNIAFSIQLRIKEKYKLMSQNGKMPFDIYF